MGINFAYERKKFYEEQKKLRTEYAAAGVAEEQIQVMYEFALHQFNRDMAYYRHTVPLANEEDTDYGCEEGRLSIYGKNADALTVTLQPSESTQYWWLDEIENEGILSYLLSLSIEDLELVDMFVYQGLKQTEIAVMTGKTQAAVSMKIATIKKNIKKVS